MGIRYQGKSASQVDGMKAEGLGALGFRHGEGGGGYIHSLEISKQNTPKLFSQYIYKVARQSIALI